ncbi:pilus assembly FimT family protein [Acinetobacter pseudolwoffii]|uniref:pilus assembly FimT family protein n=1 Tax=Acinetobacter pseudolwoffii TaxID=2053287 RepID=UPI00398966DF
MKKNKGFTLIELMVTIVVLAIIAMMAAPSFGTMLTNQNLNRSVQELVGVFNTARSKAIIERRIVTVHLQTINIASLSNNTADTFYWMPQGDATLTTSTTQLTYQLTGGVSADTVFTICGGDSPSRSKTITVSKTGTVQLVQEGAC